MLVALVLAGAVVYLNALAGPFVLDDQSAVVDNPAIRQFSTAPDVLRQHDNPIAGRPVVAGTLALDYAIGELAVAPYHITNITIHIACALLLFGIARRTLQALPLDAYARRGNELALAIALLWIVHPLNSEPVNYITQRTESLMALFLLLTLYAAIRSRAPAHESAGWQAVAVSACALGMGCKESMAVAPVIVALYDRIFVFKSFRDAFTARGRLYAMLAASWLLLAYFMWRGPRSGSVGLHHVGASTYLLNQIRMVARYLRLAVWPTDLVVNYGPVDTSLRWQDVVPHACALGVLLVAAIVGLVRRPRIAFLALWIIVTLAPTSSVIPIVTEVGAERRMYLPLIAVVAAIVLAVYSLASVRARVSRVAAMAVLTLVAATLGAVTVARNREYASALTLAQSTLRRWPTDVAHGMVGAELMARHRDDEAIAELRLAARSDARSRYNLGAALFNARQLDGAARELIGMAEAYPTRDEVPLARRLAGRAYALQRNWPEAIRQLTLAISMTPDDQTSRTWLAHALNGQGLTLVRAGKFDEAVLDFRRASDLDPTRVDARHNLVSALLDAGDAAAAEREARHAIETAPNDAESFDLLGRALALQDKMGDAVTQLRRARELAPDDARIRDDLVRVLAASQQPR